MALILVAGLLTALAPTPMDDDRLTLVRDEAATAVRALRDGDMAALDRHLAAHRGQMDFAYFFASEATPRDVGDALATVAGDGENAPFAEGVDTHAYDLALTDLAGTLALATHGTGDRALPASWTGDFIEATTVPVSLVDASGRWATQRANQDLANRQNLLLVLSRGYWSTDFLQAVTQAYWDVDHDQGDNSWIVAGLNDAKYAPAPNGSYLTDDVVALTAALTANPSASLWAFTEFQPGTATIDGTDDSIGVFAHYLFFEHRFPRSSELEDDSLGMTATLTALSSAIDAAGPTTNLLDALDGEGPMADSIVLQDLAEEATDDSGGSLLMLPWDATKRVAETVWRLTQRWGHTVLTVLSLATLAPSSHLKVVGVAAAGINAAWYAIEGDFTSAGLSLAVVVPALPFGKLAKNVKGAVRPEKSAAKAAEQDAAKTTEVARAASSNRARTVTSAYVKNRPNLRKATREQVEADAPRAADGRAIDPNTQQPINGKPVYGHKPGYEYRCLAQQALDEQWTVEKFLQMYNDPSHLQLEDKKSNESHQHESDVCRKVKV